MEAECERIIAELLWASWALARLREVPTKDKFPLFESVAMGVPEVPRNWYEVKVEAECERIIVELLWASWALARLREVPIKDKFPLFESVATEVPEVPRNWYEVKVEAECERIIVELLWASWALARLREVPTKDRFPRFDKVPTVLPEVPRKRKPLVKEDEESETSRVFPEVFWRRRVLPSWREVPTNTKFPVFDKMATGVPEVPRNWYEVKLADECERVMVEGLWVSWALARFREVPTNDRLPIFESVATGVPEVPRNWYEVKLADECERVRVEGLWVSWALARFREVPMSDRLPMLDKVPKGVPVVPRKRNPLV